MRTLRQLASEIVGLVGQPIARVVAPLDVLEGSVGADGRRGELTIHGPSGAPVAIGFTLSTLEWPDGTHHVLLFQDISTLLELRRQRDRLLQMAVLGEVMPTLLHELRNPLAAVTAMLEVLVEDADQNLQGDLHAILCEVRRMALGLQGIGGLVRTMHSSTFTAVDLAVREACRLLDSAASRRGVVLEALGPDLPLLPIDRGATCGVVFNLVKNAIDACPAGGHVRVHTRVEDGSLALSVADDGCGMTSDVLARCRELFFTTKDTGSGVGLALCAQVAEASGGSITIDSAAGQGTTVTLRVPLTSSRGD